MQNKLIWIFVYHLSWWKWHFTGIQSTDWQVGWWQSNLLSYGIIVRVADKCQVRKHSHNECLPQDAKSEHLLLNIVLPAKIRQDYFNLQGQDCKVSPVKD